MLIGEWPDCHTARLLSDRRAVWPDCPAVRVASGQIIARPDYSVAVLRVDPEGDGWTYTRMGGRTGSVSRATRQVGGKDLNSGGGPCAVIEGPELLMRTVCVNICWIASRTCYDLGITPSPIEASSATVRASEQEGVFWEACRGRCTCDLVECVDGNVSRVERLRLQRGKGRCGSGETCEGQEGLHVG